MKTQPREVYGYGSRLRTSKRLPAGWIIAIVAAAMIAGAAWA